MSLVVLRSVLLDCGFVYFRLGYVDLVWLVSLLLLGLILVCLLFCFVCGLICCLLSLVLDWSLRIMRIAYCCLFIVLGLTVWLFDCWWELSLRFCGFAIWCNLFCLL